MAEQDLNGDDHAIIAGVGQYTDTSLSSLPGARDDAGRFHRWVIHPRGGGVPRENVWVFPEHARALDATHAALNDAFRALCKRGAGKSRLGRRLYLYLSGHGIAQHVEEASLLAADGGPLDWSLHIPGEAYVRWFQYSAYFDQVVLFADCCRSARRDVPVQSFPLAAVHCADQKEVIVVRGFAAQYGQEALELENHGVFTDALLEALERASGRDGRITALTVQQYLYNHPRLQQWQVLPRFALIGDVAQVAFGSGEEQRFPVRFQVASGARLTLQGGPWTEPWAPELAGKGPHQVRLPRGIYAAKAGGRTRYFEVTGAPQEEDQLVSI
ncbi:MAG TPA: caspase family protein [Myxococcales bacterium]|nr:caspase family protein [Myxococcales bacterium]